MFVFIYARHDWDCIPNHERWIALNGIEWAEISGAKLNSSDVSLVNGTLMTIRQIYICARDCSLYETFVKLVGTRKKRRRGRRKGWRCGGSNFALRWDVAIEETKWCSMCIYNCGGGIAKTSNEEGEKGQLTAGRRERKERKRLKIREAETEGEAVESADRTKRCLVHRRDINREGERWREQGREKRKRIIEEKIRFNWRTNRTYNMVEIYVLSYNSSY